MKLMVLFLLALVIAGARTLRFPSSGHALNAAARFERAEWLRHRLDLKAIDREAYTTFGIWAKGVSHFADNG